ncbi:SAP domain-containing protein [Podarcis lilfordi]|nr:SAP domain-containing protein [Podarcis lilfordi]
MSRKSRRVVKLASKTPPEMRIKGDSSCGSPSLDYNTLKRTELQQWCKKFGLRATGKNAELVERLKAFHRDPEPRAEETSKTDVTLHDPETPLTVPPLDLTKAVKTEPSAEKADVIHGWCVVHGMVLYHPVSSWAPLLLRGGSVCVQDGEDIVPFHLTPLMSPVPDGFSDNYICESCVLRNREEPKRCPTCLQIQMKQNRATLSQGQTLLRGSMSQSSFLAGGDVSKDRRRTFEIKKLYQPQEDQAYAQRVDGILSQMASGELGMDRVLRPLHPLVVHSPAPFER